MHRELKKYGALMNKPMASWAPLECYLISDFSSKLLMFDNKICLLHKFNSSFHCELFCSQPRYNGNFLPSLQKIFTWKTLYALLQSQGDWPCGLSVVNLSQGSWFTSHLGVRTGLGFQPRYEAPGDFLVETDKNANVG